MLKPIRAEENEEQGTVALFFDYAPKQGIAHRTRGAVRWPSGMNPGYCLISAQDVRTRVLTVFEEFPFYSVGSVDGEPGIWKCLGDAWRNYKCRRLYYAIQDTHSRYAIQVARESLVTIKPSFIEVELASKDDQLNCDNLILEYNRRKLIKIDRDAKHITSKLSSVGNLFDQLQVYSKGYSTNEDSLPAVIALRALIAGIERTPYRTPAPEPMPQVSYY